MFVGLGKIGGINLDWNFWAQTHKVVILLWESFQFDFDWSRLKVLNYIKITSQSSASAFLTRRVYTPKTNTQHLKIECLEYDPLHFFGGPGFLVVSNC